MSISYTKAELRRLRDFEESVWGRGADAGASVNQAPEMIEATEATK